MNLDVRVVRIRERVTELVEPSWTTVTQYMVEVDDPTVRPPWAPRRVEVPFDPDAHLLVPWIPRSRTVEHPSLIVQLEQSVGRGTAGVSSAGHESRPVVSVPAVDALGIMHRESVVWVRSGFRVRPSSDPVENLAVIAGRAQDLGADQLATLDGDVLRWWGRARIVTTWDLPPLKPHVPCMACGKRGGLQVRVDHMVAVCLECGATWDARTIGILGTHVRLAMAAAPKELAR